MALRHWRPPAAAGSQSPYLVMLGRINWKKRIDIALEAVKLVDGIRLVIAGGDDDGLAAALRARAAALGVAERVEFVGPVAGLRKRQLLQGALALLMPSLSENFGNSALEAMAEGTPVIVVPAGGHRGQRRGIGWRIRRGARARRHSPMPSGNCRRTRTCGRGWVSGRGRRSPRSFRGRRSARAWRTSIARSWMRFSDAPDASRLSMLDQITPLILTLDEEANIERVLARLRWAREVVVVDSGSSDATRACWRASRTCAASSTSSRATPRNGTSGSPRRASRRIGSWRSMPTTC